MFHKLDFDTFIFQDLLTPSQNVSSTVKNFYVTLMKVFTYPQMWFQPCTHVSCNFIPFIGLCWELNSKVFYFRMSLLGDRASFLQGQWIENEAIVTACNSVWWKFSNKKGINAFQGSTICEAAQREGSQMTAKKGDLGRNQTCGQVDGGLTASTIMGK